MKLNTRQAKNIIKRSLIETIEGLNKGVIGEMAIPSYLEGTKLSRWFAWQKVNRVLQICGQPQNASILDFGCGSGIMFETLGQLRNKIYAVDIELLMAKSTASLLNMGNIIFSKPDEMDEKIPDQSIDIVIAANVLEHVASLSECLQLFLKKLKNEGLLIVSGPTENFVYRIGRSCLRAIGHQEFSGDYHLTNIQKIFWEIKQNNFELNKIVKLPLPGILSLYWVGQFKKHEK